MRSLILSIVFCFICTSSVLAYDFEDGERSDEIIEDMESRKNINRANRNEGYKRSRSIINKNRYKISSRKELEKQRVARNKARNLRNKRLIKKKRRHSSRCCNYNYRTNRTYCR